MEKTLIHKEIETPKYDVTQEQIEAFWGQFADTQEIAWITPFPLGPCKRGGPERKLHNTGRLNGDAVIFCSWILMALHSGNTKP